MDRWFSMGIAEQSATAVAAGLAREGKLPVFGTYGVFASGRNLDQLRTTVCYGEFNVFIAGAHGGVSVGPDGATHQALEELYQMCGIPNMNVEVPCDSVETKRATEHLLFKVKGPKYVRFAREATPVVTDKKTPYKWGKANVIRFRGAKPKFKDAFEHTLASKYKNENEDISIIACGPSVPEAMRAAWILKDEYGIETRVLNVHTVKPLDTTAIVKAAADTGVVMTAEEHQIGGFGNQVAAAIGRSEKLYGKPDRHGHDRGQRPLRRVGRTVGARQGVRGLRRAHCGGGEAALRPQGGQDHRRIEAEDHRHEAEEGREEEGFQEAQEVELLLRETTNGPLTCGRPVLHLWVHGAGGVERPRSVRSGLAPRGQARCSAGLSARRSS